MAMEPGIEKMPTPAGAPVAKKSKLPLIAGAVVALLLVRWMASGSGGSSSSSSSNPVIGEWNLVDPAAVAYCPTYQKFTASKSTYTQSGKTYTATPIYDIKSPTLVVVGYGGSYIADWTVQGPDDVTAGQTGPPPYGVPSFCKYHRK